MKESLEYSNLDEAKERIMAVLNSLLSHGFGRLEIYVVNGEPSQIDARLSYKLRKNKLS